MKRIQRKYRKINAHVVNNLAIRQREYRIALLLRRKSKDNRFSRRVKTFNSMDPTRWVRESIADPDGSRAKCHAKDPLVRFISRKVQRKLRARYTYVEKLASRLKILKRQESQRSGEVV